MLDRSWISLAVCLLLMGNVASCAPEDDDEPPAAADAGMDDDVEDDGDFDDWTWDDDDDAQDAALDASKRVQVRPGKQQNAELIETLPVGRSSAGADRRVVMRLEPGDIPKLERGDRLIVPAEVQVTTRCDVGQTAPGCNYNPKVGAQILLTGSRGDTDPSGGRSKALSDVKTLSCTRGEHHCMFVFRPGDTNRRIDGGFDLPCVRDNTCHINLVMWAWHPDARAGGVDRVLVGANERNFLENGIVEQDRGRTMVIRERGISGDDRRRRETSGGGDRNVPTDASPVVVYSHKLKKGNLKAGEQFVVEAKVPVSVGSRARFSTRMFVTKNANETDGSGLGKIAPGEIGEHNGINCTPSNSPCTVRKVAVFRATGNIDGPVYVNLVAKSAVPGGGNASVTVKRNKGWLRSTRYRAGVSD
jgi:hypothetical protein